MFVILFIMVNLIVIGVRFLTPPMENGKLSLTLQIILQIIMNRIIICEAVENPERIIVAYRVPDDRSSAIFYAYNVQHRNWGMLAPRKRKLHRFLLGAHEDWCQEGAVSANNTLYWIHHADKFRIA
jgi:hypothetical protein